MSVHAIVADIGTGSVKIAAFSAAWKPVASGVGEYRGRGANPDSVDAESWYAAFVAAVHDLATRADVSAARFVVLSGQMQNLIPVAAGGATGSAVMYYASRPGESFDRLLSRYGYERLRAETHNVPDASGFPAKLLWLAAGDRAERESLKRAEAILCGAHDYVAYRLTGTAATDPTTASTTGLYDPVAGRWVPELTDALPISRAHLPEVVTGDHADGTIDPDRAAELGISPEAIVIHGVGDVGSAMLSTELSGYSRSCYLGTSGWILDAGDLAQPADPELGVFNLRHPVAERLIRVAPLLTAAGAFDWLIDVLDHAANARSDLFGALGQEAAALKPADTRVLFLPYLAGERSPFKDPLASAGFIGVRADTGRRELFRAVAEGVAFALKSVLSALEEGTGGDAAQLPMLLSGGGATIAGFPQLLADIAGTEVAVLGHARFAGTRALPVLAGAGRVMTDSRNDADVNIYQPRDSGGIYERKYRLFREAYQQNRELMHALGELQ